MEDSTDHTDADDGASDATDDCTTTGSFDDHGIDDGSALIRRTHYRLRGRVRRRRTDESYL